MGLSPDYKAALMNTLGANAGFYGDFADNARAWHRRCQEAVFYLNHAIVNPPVDRDKPSSEVRDVYLHVKRETDGGIIVSGAQVVARNTALTPHNSHAPTTKRKRLGQGMSVSVQVHLV